MTNNSKRLSAQNLIQEIQTTTESGDTEDLKKAFCLRLEEICTPAQVKEIQEQYLLFERDCPNNYLELINGLSE